MGEPTVSRLDRTAAVMGVPGVAGYNNQRYHQNSPLQPIGEHRQHGLYAHQHGSDPYLALNPPRQQVPRTYPGTVQEVPVHGTPVIRPITRYVPFQKGTMASSLPSHPSLPLPLKQPTPVPAFTPLPTLQPRPQASAPQATPLTSAFVKEISKLTTGQQCCSLTIEVLMLLAQLSPKRHSPEEITTFQHEVEVLKSRYANVLGIDHAYKELEAEAKRLRDEVKRLKNKEIKSLKAKERKSDARIQELERETEKQRHEMKANAETLQKLRRMTQNYAPPTK
ncbi:uncharacterized protein DSM5745_00734 [Aspergillus mulundensis]|uniref:Uncharacterized protein n=1 Tax=Aspergillus mulundensis TaxID=1810919 RepID=A0A3D8T4C3_9EURO|nr:hypothetical protein DSM5745_00734 [Aspergillus mulundensis]RDW93412.1 hypothetical protein DSM5745_00734 [Aspergillus mulundensis]